MVWEINDKSAEDVSDEDWHLVLQLGSVPGGTVKKLDATDLLDLIFGAEKTTRSLEGIDNIPQYNRLVGVTTVGGANHTLVLTDDGKLIQMTSASANTVTVPPNASVAFALYTVVHVVQGGAGVTTLVEGSGVTINRTDTLVARAQHSWLSLCKIGTNTWQLTGDVNPS